MIIRFDSNREKFQKENGSVVLDGISSSARSHGGDIILPLSSTLSFFFLSSSSIWLLSVCVSFCGLFVDASRVRRHRAFR